MKTFVIKIDNENICYKNWILNGILYVKDHFNIDGQFKTFQEL